MPRGRVARNPTTRFFEKTVVISSNHCWLWIGGKFHSGYGCFWTGEKNVRAHRWIFQQLVNSIPTGLVIDHLCKNKLCVNPNHLEVVSQTENCLRDDTNPATINGKKTHCIHGHEFTAENTYLRSEGGRSCKSCWTTRRQNKLNQTGE